MNILMLTPRFPYPPTRGDVVRAWSQLQYLADRHDLWLACVDRNAPRPEHLARVRRICRAVACARRSAPASLLHGGAGLLRGQSLTEGFFGSASLRRTIRSWAATVWFDAVLTFSSAMAPFAELVPAPRRVLDLNDVDSHKWAVYARRSSAPLGWLYALESRRLRAAERRWVRSHNVTLVVNERERRRLVTQLDPRGSDVVRTCVSAAGHNDRNTTNSPPSAAGGPIVGTLGSLFYPPNVRAIEWFAGHVWPRVKRAVPAARWWIVGNRPVRRVRRCGRAPGVTVTGFVPDIRPYLDAMRVFVNPVDGDIGVQTKLLFALAAGKPAVVTPDSAAGIDYVGEPPFLIARQPADFAEAVVRVLRDEPLAERLSVRARRLIDTDYRLDGQVQRVEQWLTGEPLSAPNAPACGPRTAISTQPEAQHPADAAAEVFT